MISKNPIKKIYKKLIKKFIKRNKNLTIKNYIEIHK